MKNLVLSMAVILSSLSLYSQDPCITLIADSSEWEKSEIDIRTELISKSADAGQHLNFPTVVHVVHHGEVHASNISDEQIMSAIDDLNLRLNEAENEAEGGEVMNATFCLAQQDPDGNETSGIVRHDGCAISADFCEGGVKIGAYSGTAMPWLSLMQTIAWPNQEYYNIVVVAEINNNSGGGIQAFAYFPTVSTVDGICILYNAFGTTGTLKSFTNQNKTLVHEVGHTCALFHTFNSTSSCSGETNCLIQGDRVCDTPQQTVAYSCNFGSCGFVSHNYMDYLSQNCREVFTEGQVARWRASAITSRPNLIASDKCEPIGQVCEEGSAMPENYEVIGNTIYWSTPVDSAFCKVVAGQNLFDESSLSFNGQHSATFPNLEPPFRYRVRCTCDLENYVDWDEGPIILHSGEESVEFERGSFRSKSGQEVDVYDILGRKLVNKNLSAGLYVVRVGEHAYKFVVQ